MGKAAKRVQRHLRERLACVLPRYEWHEEHVVGDTPVDVAGVGDALVLVELEWRRADPANNTVKLFREFVETDLASSFDSVHVVQLFSRYYDLAAGGVSTKRRNAVFVGGRVAETVPAATFTAVTLGIDPPKRGGDLPEGWRESAEDAADRIDREVTRER
ncbi:hypothetical protein [Halobaculum gomorrense]|uniref:Uncharacterized protein n=1 Tax=Halobaculum gomorrense TaxID=43928 RepID=A0A1M5JUJ1_9EURY|nr:hypothetical protein [Halobaculum gomorrense]SHG44282.1 hypothetical protein SAMN05443636_0273 [Halobaculum gomorrense]